MKDVDNIPLTFGKYKGYSPNAIMDEFDDYRYLIWLTENVDEKLVSEELVACCYETDEGFNQEDDLGMSWTDFQ